MNRALYYFHDPMCSWCYGFNPTLQKLKALLPKEIEFIQVLGGLAPDTTDPMPEELQQRLQSNWNAIIKKIAGTQFNFDFWTECQPVRSTYQSCRAVLCAKNISEELENKMIEQIQRAYYQQAKNPSLTEVLIECAEIIGIETNEFTTNIASDEIEQQLQDEIKFGQSMNVNAYPSLKLKADQSIWPITVDYNDADIMLNEIDIVS